MPVCRKRARVGGIVQGVGFRPFLWRLSSRHGLSGWVENGPTGVVAEVQGEEDAIITWLAAIRGERPPLAVIETIDVEDLPIDPTLPTGFVIHDALDATAASATTARFDLLAGPRFPAAPPPLAGPTVVPPDVATCPACLAEIDDPANRRHRYPFTSCTDCGPRFTIVESLPYDRTRTSMKVFPMCDACAAEYHAPADRRFHAEATACPACGPIVWFTRAADDGGIQSTRPVKGLLGNAAIDAVRAKLRAGEIVAIKGLGGFHLVCDATNAGAVERLRHRKGRTGKPLAVMVADIATARMLAEIDEQERRILESRERPIVLAQRSPQADCGKQGSDLADAVAPGNDFIGVMLPATPLQYLICVGMPPLVMTSGNQAEEPIAHDNAEAAARLCHLADGFLMHDLRIVAPCDDSVVRCVAGAAMPIRRSRGFTAVPIRLGAGGPTVLAVGGELKATLCLAHGEEAVMSQHIGDMGSLETYESLGRAADHLLRLLRATPQAVACDLHPGYVSTAWARRFALDRGIPLVAVQHHEAHVASLLADQAALDRPIIGVCFDGTGYGRDGTIQGGEFFTVDRGTFRRAANLATFALPGGDASIRHPWRTAIAVLHAAGISAAGMSAAGISATGIGTAGISGADRLPPFMAAPAAARRLLETQLDTLANQTGGQAATTSMGRLFDVVASLAGVRHSITYEAEAAMALEAIAETGCDPREPYAMPSLIPAETTTKTPRSPVADASPPFRIDWRPAVAAIVEDVNAGVPPAGIADRFHRGVAAMIAAVCRKLRDDTGIASVGLTGGVFQNARIVRLAVERLQADGFDVLLHERVPPNDGGIALGQAVIARGAFARRDT